MTRNIKKAAYSFILLLGIVSLLSDMAYEGARSIIGPYLGPLGASATTVGSLPVLAGMPIPLQLSAVPVLYAVRKYMTK